MEVKSSNSIYHGGPTCIRPCLVLSSITTVCSQGSPGGGYHWSHFQVMGLKRLKGKLSPFTILKLTPSGLDCSFCVGTSEVSWGNTNRSREPFFEEQIPSAHFQLRWQQKAMGLIPNKCYCDTGVQGGHQLNHLGNSLHTYLIGTQESSHLTASPSNTNTHWHWNT